MPRERSLPAALASAVLLAAAVGGAQTPSPSGPPRPDPAARPCLDRPEHRALDFWVGEWDVRGVTQPKDAPPSRSRIERVEDGCVIAEHYTTAGGYSGRSLNAYSTEKKRWEQFWTDNKGEIHHYLGQAREGNMYYEAQDVQFAGMPARGTVRMTFFSQGPDRVRQLGESSLDGGRTWTTMYDLTYTRRRP